MVRLSCRPSPKWPSSPGARLTLPGSETWPSQKPQDPSGGAAFAAVQAGTQRLGFFTTLLADPRSGQNPAQRLLAEINAVGQWETNQVQTFVIGASWNPFSRESAKALRRASSAFERAGLVDATEAIPTEAKATLRSEPGQTGAMADSLFAGPLGFPSNSRITISRACAHYPVTCDVELDPDKVSTALDIRAEDRRQKAAETALLIRKVEYWAVGSAGLGLVVVFIWRTVGKRARLPSPLPNRLPARIVPKESTSQLRPVIFAQPRDNPGEPERPVAPRMPRPVLRLQSSVTQPPEPPRQGPETESTPQTQITRPSQLPTREEPIDRTETPARQESPGPAQGEDISLRQGVISELSGWLKQKLLRKLVTDRAQLMEAQQLATRMATTLDSRLSRIEAQIQQQNQAYVRRIDELNRELAAAREENRELIRERIAQVRAEMEAARARVLAEANLDTGSFRL